MPTASDFGVHDIGEFDGTPAEVALRAVVREQVRTPATVLVKDFDTGALYTVSVAPDGSADVTDAWV